MDKIKNGKSILLVEDEKILTDTLSERLIDEGFGVYKSYNGIDGLQIALTKHPDLILLDLLLPGPDGLDVLRRLRKDSWGKNAKVIVLTNVKDTNKLAEGMDIGLDGADSAYEYIIKTDWSLESVILKIKDRLGVVA